MLHIKFKQTCVMGVYFNLESLKVKIFLISIIVPQQEIANEYFQRKYAIRHKIYLK